MKIKVRELRRIIKEELENTSFDDLCVNCGNPLSEEIESGVKTCEACDEEYFNPDRFASLSPEDKADEINQRADQDEIEMMPEDPHCIDCGAKTNGEDYCPLCDPKGF